MALISVAGLALAGTGDVAVESGQGARTAGSVPSAEQFIAGNATFILLHELGHAIIREFRVPLLGLEEDSADTIAAVVLLDGERASPKTQQRLSEILAMAAAGNSLLWQTGLEKANAEVTVWSQHSLSIKRFARMACLLYGSDTKRFQWVADATKMNEIRADWCEDELATARRGVGWLVREFGIPDGRSTQDQITVRYEQPRTAGQEQLVSILRQRELIETVTGFVDRYFDFPQPFPVKVKSCASPNAYWDVDARELLFCYELLDGLRQLTESPEFASVQKAIVAGL